MRIGAVNYLNSKPLVYGLESLAPQVRVTYDLPSRLADSLVAGRLDVALVPSVEFFRTPSSTIVSDACVACRGPVLSVKLHFRVPPQDVRRVALDEGSRTSAALTRILLAEIYGVQPTWEPLPIGCGIETTDADAVLLIGDRAIADSGRNSDSRASSSARLSLPNVSTPTGAQERPVFAESYSRRPATRNFVEIWDLGSRWTEWTGLPFVFAMWIARPGVDVSEVAGLLGSARDNGVRNLAEIAEREGPLVGISQKLAIRYFRDNLHFVLGNEELAGLRKFYSLCVKHGLAPSDGEARLASRAVTSAKPPACRGFYNEK
jgi:chorismate dehydratase